MIKKLLLLLLALLAFIGVSAEDISFSASAPNTVIMDKPFQLRFTVNASGGKDFRAPDIKDFEVLAGPFESRSSSYQIINGNATSSVTITYTYTLLPKKTGTFTIPSASIQIKGEKYTSSGVSIKVLPADQEAPASQGGQQGGGGQPRQSSGGTANISKESIFIRSILSKSSVYEQEPVLLTYKIYTTNDIIQYSNKSMSDFSGFMKQEVEQAPNKQLAYENYNGKNYMTAVLFEVLLYPQKEGTLAIDKADFETIIRIQNNRAVRSIFDDFFDSYTNVNKSVSAPAVRIQVKKLPEGKPADYSGFVGSLSLTSNITTQSVKVNEAVTLKINLTGKGNLKILGNPQVKFPDDFEAYDPKVTNNFKTNASGTNGTKSLEYMFIPRHSGEFEIPSVSLSYFDLASKTYKTLQTPAYKIVVLKGDGSAGEGQVVSSYVNKEQVRQISKDIRYIQTGDVDLIPAPKLIFGSWVFWLLYLVPLFIALVLVLVFGKSARQNSDLAFVKNRKANTVAQKRLKLAAKFLKEGKKEQYYEEVLKAVWTYISDKLSIPVAELTKEKVERELLRKSVSNEQIASILNVLNTCEFARYAPNTGQEAMGNLYNETVEIISSLEQQLKK